MGGVQGGHGNAAFPVGAVPALCRTPHRQRASLQERSWLPPKAAPRPLDRWSTAHRWRSKAKVWFIQYRLRYMFSVPVANFRRMWCWMPPNFAACSARVPSPSAVCAFVVGAERK